MFPYRQTMLFPARHFPVFLLLLGPLLASAESDALFSARKALADGQPAIAETLARKAYAEKGASRQECDEALDVLFQALADLKNPEAMLAVLKPGELQGPPLPSDGRDALWRAKAQLDLGHSEEALATLRGALPLASPGIAARIRRQIPAALLAHGETNAALSAYAQLRDEPAATQSPETFRLSLERARIYACLGIHTNVLSEVDFPESAPPDLRAAARVLRADALLGLERRDEGLSLLREIAEDESPANRPHRAEAALSLARLDAAGDGTLVTNYVAMVSDFAPGTETEHQALRLAALHLYASGDAKDAAEFYQKAQTSPHATPASRSDLALACARKAFGGDPQTALALVDGLLRNETESMDLSPAVEAEAHFGRGAYLLALGQCDAADIALARAEEMAEASGNAPLRDHVRFRRGQAFKAAKNPARAIECFSLASAPESALPYNDRAEAALLIAQTREASDEPDRCEADYFQVVNTFPEARKAVQSALLRLASRALERDRSLLAYDRYLTAAENPVVAADSDVLCDALIGAGIAASRERNFDDALDVFSKAAAETNSVHSLQAACLRIGALYGAGRDAEAVAAGQALVHDHPESPWATNAALWLGTYHYNHGQFDQAAIHLAFFAEHAPDRPEAPPALLATTRAFRNLKDYEQAERAAASLITLFPDSPAALEARLIQGEILQEQMRYAEAILAFDAIVHDHPGSPAATKAIRLKGHCLFALGAEDPARYAAAETCFRSLADDVTPPPFEDLLDLHYRIGRCRERQEDYQTAFHVYYQDVVLAFNVYVEKNEWPSEAAVGTYTRAAFNAADIADRQLHDTQTAISILQDLANRSIPEQATAKERLNRLLHH